MTPSAFIFLYENQLFLTFRNRTVAVWNFRGELVTSFEDHLLWHPDCNTNNIYITSDQDLIISYCKTESDDPLTEGHGRYCSCWYWSGKRIGLWWEWRCNVNGKEGLESSSNIVKNSTVNKEGVANVYVKSRTVVDSIMAGHDKPHDENVGPDTKKSMNFRSLITPSGNGIDMALLVESVRAISERFVNTAYGFFLGKRVAYPVLANYFSSMDGLDSMLENGSWFIRNNPLILKKWNPNVNLLKEDVVNVSVWVKLHGVPMMAFSEDGLSVIATKLGTSLMLDLYTSDKCMQSWGRSSYARSMIELLADVELKVTTVVAMPKLIGEWFYTYTVRVEYEWKPSRCACCKVFGYVQDECPKNIGSDVVKNLKKPNQAPKGVPVGPKVGFKSVKQMYRPKKNNINTSGNKKKDVESTKEVSNLNPFDVLNLVENDVDLGTNGGTSNLASKEVDYPSDHDSEDDIAPVDNEMTSFQASERVGYGTNSLLEQ
nr:hypothetical protein [Tanacetum cinerariifolium]